MIENQKTGKPNRLATRRRTMHPLTAMAPVKLYTATIFEYRRLSRCIVPYGTMSDTSSFSHPWYQR